jgi:RNA polymerase sigma-70 factor (ECF subfamily)
MAQHLTDNFPPDPKGSLPLGSLASAPEGVEELQLVEAAKVGDRVAFGKLAQRYQRQCAGVAIRLLGNSHDAAELVQEALLKAYSSLGQLNQAQRFGPWLMRIVTNLSLNYRRSRQLRKATSIEQTSQPDGDDIRSSLPELGPIQPERIMASAELGDAIQQALNALPEKQRLALVLFAIEEMSQRDVAETLDCSIEMVKWHVFQARKTLRVLLAEHVED